MNSRMYTMGIVVALKNAFSANAKIIDRELKSLQKSLGMYSREVKIADEYMAKFGVGVKRLVGGLAILSTLNLPTRQFIEFETAMAEVMTIADPATGTFNELALAVERLSMAFGETPAKQAKALYQTISSGVLDSQQAIQLMETANKGAIAGIATSFEVVDVMTSILNAYTMSVGEAARVSDQLFVAVKLGKTTMPELAAELGDVSAIAAMSGISIGEITSAMATLTLTGQSTATAVTNLRGLLTNIIRPKKEALDMAEQLGIKFNINEVKNKGLMQYLIELGEAAQNNAEVYGKFFRRIEGMNAVMALVGMKDKYQEVQEAIMSASGNTEEAYNKIMKTTGKQLELLRAKTTVIFQRIGSAVGVILEPTITALSKIIGLVATGFQEIPILKYIVAVPILVSGLTLISKGIKDIAFWGIRAGNLFFDKWLVSKGLDPYAIKALWSVPNFKVAFQSMTLPILGLIAAITILSKAWTKASDNVIKKTTAIRTALYDSKGLFIQQYAELSLAQKEAYKETYESNLASAEAFREANGELKGLTKSLYFVENLNPFEKLVYNTSKFKEALKVAKLLYGALDENGKAIMYSGTELRKYYDAYAGTSLWRTIDRLTQIFYKLKQVAVEFGKHFLKPFEWVVYWLQKALEGIEKLKAVWNNFMSENPLLLKIANFLYSSRKLIVPIIAYVAVFKTFVTITSLAFKGFVALKRLLGAIPEALTKFRMAGNLKDVFEQATTYKSVRQGYKYLVNKRVMNPAFAGRGLEYIKEAEMRSLGATKFFKNLGNIKALQSKYNIDAAVEPQNALSAMAKMVAESKRGIATRLRGKNVIEAGLKVNLEQLPSISRAIDKIDSLQENLKDTASKTTLSNLQAALRQYQSQLYDYRSMKGMTGTYTKMQQKLHYSPAELENMAPRSVSKLWDDLSRNYNLEKQLEVSDSIKKATAKSRFGGALANWYSQTRLGRGMATIKDKLFVSPYRKITNRFKKSRGIPVESEEILQELERTMGVKRSGAGEPTLPTTVPPTPNQLIRDKVLDAGAVNAKKLRGGAEAQTAKTAGTLLIQAGKELMSAAQMLKGSNTNLAEGIDYNTEALRNGFDETAYTFDDATLRTVKTQIASDVGLSLRESAEDKLNTGAIVTAVGVGNAMENASNIVQITALQGVKAAMGGAVASIGGAVTGSFSTVGSLITGTLTSQAMGLISILSILQAILPAILIISGLAFAGYKIWQSIRDKEVKRQKEEVDARRDALRQKYNYTVPMTESQKKQVVASRTGTMVITNSNDTTPSGSSTGKSGNIYIYPKLDGVLKIGEKPIAEANMSYQNRMQLQKYGVGNSRIG